MDRPAFNRKLDDEFERIKKLNATKGQEYSGDDDVLSDFRAVAYDCGITQEQALMTYATKHWRAINAYAKTGGVLSEPIEGRIRDLILYSLLFLAMIEDGQDVQPTRVPRPLNRSEADE